MAAYTQGGSVDRDAWINVQKKTFTRWANNHLKKRNIEIEDLYEDVKDGVALHPDWSLDNGGGGGEEEEEEEKEEEEEECDSVSSEEGEPKGESSAYKMPTASSQRLCLECPLPDHHPTVLSMKVCDDPESGGCFILDPTGGPKWRLVSTRSSFSVHFPKKIIKIVKFNRQHN